MSTALHLAQLARTLTGRFVFQKKLPRDFGGAGILVTSRSDIRLLTPGFQRTAADLIAVASAYIQPGSCVWDLGSNLGIFAFCAAWKAGQTGKVFTLEADPFYSELQQRSVRRLPAGYAPVVPLCAAVSDRMGVLELAIPRNGHSRSHLTMVAGNSAEGMAARKQVVSVTADFLVGEWPRPDFVKVDVEGAEMLFLQGATRLLETVRPTLYIEVNEANQQPATEILERWNYDLFALSPDGTESKVRQCLFNTVAKPRERGS